MSYNAVETTKNICCAKSKGKVDHSIVTREVKKFRTAYKNFDDQAKIRWAEKS